jgi:hypothetical protein
MSMDVDDTATGARFYMFYNMTCSSGGYGPSANAKAFSLNGNSYSSSGWDGAGYFSAPINGQAVNGSVLLPSLGGYVYLSVAMTSCDTINLFQIN